MSTAPSVEKGEQTYVCTSLKMLAMKTPMETRGTAPKLWPRSPITEIQGLVGTPLSTPLWLPAMGVPRGSTTESQGMEWMSTGARVSDWDCMLYSLNPHNRRPGHTHTLTGHIIPDLKIASLIRIRPLCKVGCKVIFDNEKCDVVYKGRVILRGYKDPSTDLWTLPITKEGMRTTPSQNDLPRPCPEISRAPHPPLAIYEGASFLHSVQTRANNIKFAHQSLYNPKLSTLLKAT
jgi:hypothetical protein